MSLPSLKIKHMPFGVPCWYQILFKAFAKALICLRWWQGRDSAFPRSPKKDGSAEEEKQHYEDSLWELSQQIREDCMGAQGRSEWEDLLLSYSARKMAFFTFWKVWFEFGVLQMRKDGTASVTDLPKATQRVKGKAEERIHCSSVGGQRSKLLV